MPVIQTKLKKNTQEANAQPSLSFSLSFFLTKEQNFATSQGKREKDHKKHYFYPKKEGAILGFEIVGSSVTSKYDFKY